MIDLYALERDARRMASGSPKLPVCCGANDILALVAITRAAVAWRDATEALNKRARLGVDDDESGAAYSAFCNGRNGLRDALRETGL